MDRFPLPKARVCASVDLRKQALSGALGTADLRAACVQQRSPLATSVSEEERKEEEEEVEEEEAADGPPAPLLSSCSAAAGPHTKASQAQTHHPRSRRAPDLTSWRQYWDERLEVELPGRGTFSVYCAGPATAPAALLCLHGAGYTGLTWSLVAQRLKHKYRVYAPDLRGHGLTRTASDTDFSHQTIAQDVAELWAALRCTAPHPPTPESGPPPSPPTPASNAPEQSAGAVPPVPHAPAAPVSSPPAPALLLVGHSMGGAMAVWAAAGTSAAAPAAPCAEAAAAGPAAGQAGGTAPQGSRRPPGPPPPALPGLAGLVVVDVVEGTALAQPCPSCQVSSVVASRPTSFPSASQAVSWALATGMARLPEAAAISIPAQLRQLIEEPAAAQGGEQQGGQQQQQQQQEEGGEPAAAGEHQGGQSQRQDASGTAEDPTRPGQAGGGTAGEGAGPGGGGGQGPGSVCGSGAWVWRTPLLATQPYWQAWYSGLSDAFLQVPGPKLLILAGTDRLDRALTIGQMQGRFQLVLLPQAGHAVQEDQAEATARHLADFLAHFRIGEPPMVLPRAPPGTRPVLPLVVGPVLPGRAPGLL
ncbi:Alpha/Beta hydrolase protein [Haematococcus lacustris]